VLRRLAHLPRNPQRVLPPAIRKERRHQRRQDPRHRAETGAHTQRVGGAARCRRRKNRQPRHRQQRQHLRKHREVLDPRPPPHPPMAPPTPHAPSPSAPPPVRFTTRDGVKKIPTPMIAPTTTLVASIGPKTREGTWPPGISEVGIGPAYRPPPPTAASRPQPSN